MSDKTPHPPRLTQAEDSSAGDTCAGDNLAGQSEVSFKQEETEAAADLSSCQNLPPRDLPAGRKQPSTQPSVKTATVQTEADVAASPSSPSFSQALARKLCTELAKGRTLKAVCASSQHFPPPHIVRKWAMEDVGGFASAYAKARELGFYHMADEMIEIVDREDGNITRDKLRVDTRKWLLSKAMPKGFGETPEVTTSVKLELGTDDYELGKKIAFALELSSRAESEAD